MQTKQRITVLLCFLCCIICAAAQQLSVASFKRMPTDMDARVNHPIVNHNGKKCAIIKVETSSTGFSFDTGTLSVQEVRQKVGEIWVYVQPKVRKITINHATLGILREYIFPEQIDEATVYVMKLESAAAAPVSNVRRTGFLIVESTPSDAEVWINDEWLGNTPFSKKYPIGTKVQYSVKKQLHHSEVGVATVTEAQTKLNVALKPAYGSLQVKSAPAGAVVYMDAEAQPVGTTPFTLEQVASGSHKLRFQMPMYETANREVVVTDGGSASVNVPLQARFATLTIKSLPGAAIEVDGKALGTGSVVVKQSEGICDIKATLAGHRDAQQQLTVEAGKDETIQLNPIPIYGSLAIESTPMGANIFVDGRACGTTPNVIEELLVGEHSVLVSKPGCADYKATVTIAEGEETAFEAKLQAGAQVKISTGSAGDDVYVDGKKVGTTPLNATLSFGSHKVYAMRGSKKSQEKTVNITTVVQNENIKLSFGGPVEFTVKGVKFSMIEVEGGTFTMGATNEQGSDAYSDEKTTHKVTLDSYYIGQTEVTQALWKAVMGNNPSYRKGDNLPVEQVSWNECQEFIKKLNALTGRKFRLPTEAEWEYAARGGNRSRGYKYSGSNNIDEVAWYGGNSGSKTHDVATKKANELGIYDMSGNVWEWCGDWYGSYSSSPQTNPVGPSSGSARVNRGGSWIGNSGDCRVSFRAPLSPGDSYNNLGLRLVLDEKEVNVPTNVLNDNATPANSGKNMDFTVNGVKFSMVKVAGGTFTMGATKEQGSDAADNEKPSHKVTLGTYFIGQTEVTQTLWQAVMGKNPSYHKGNDLPVEKVSWNDCQEFIKKLNALTGKKFRLPTEAEWEYAARGGNRSRGYKYSGSNSIDEVAWYGDNSGDKTHAVATKKANELGIYDMSGNVWEWCSDRYGNYSSSSQVNPVGSSSGSSRVCRGGSWYFISRLCRVSRRFKYSPGFSSYYLGLRLVLVP